MVFLETTYFLMPFLQRDLKNAIKTLHFKNILKITFLQCHLKMSFKNYILRNGIFRNDIFRNDIYRNGIFRNNILRNDILRYDFF